MDKEQYPNEVREALEKDTTRLGDVYRLVKKGKSSDEIAKELNVSTPGFVSNNRIYIRAIKNGDLSESPTMAGRCGQALRGFIKRGREYLSEKTIQELERWAEECDRRASNPQALEEEDTKVEKETSQAEESFEKSGIAGIYVYTYPHYYRHPVVRGKNDEADNRTYLKIGMSKKDAAERVMQQKTGMPERPMILQIWEIENDGDLREIEKKIHEHLRKAGHGDHYSESREWFLTNEQFVASTANLIGLKLHYEHNPEMDD